MMEGSGMGTSYTNFPSPNNQSSPLRPDVPNGSECPSLGGTSGVANETGLLNSSQLAARHAVAKELPVYSGDPEEWPLFFTTYENTTKLCGFTPEENMVRLHRCLRGKALEAVRCQLLHPSNLEHVISTLKMLFGRPEIIVHTLVEKINKIPPPRADKLNTLVDFALAVRNMVATIKACKLDEHLFNITLLQSVVERLPPMVKLNWATYRMLLSLTSLTEFSEWLYGVAEAASAVTMPPTLGLENKPRRGGNKEAGFLNFHSERSTGSATSECMICQGSCGAVAECEEFRNLGLQERWDALREYKLCRTCLGTHRGPCRSGRTCGQNGCAFKHHYLLHNDRSDKPANFVGQHAQPDQLTCDMRNLRVTQYNVNTHDGGEKSVLFQYVPVVLHHQGKTVQTYAFVDGGSQMTLLEQDLATELDLRGEKHPLCIRWTADHCRFEESAERVSLQVSGKQNVNNKHPLTDVYTVKELKLPSQSLPLADMCHKYSYLRGLPVESYSNVRPRLLIGMNNIRLGHALDSREGRLNEPFATKTRLGWTIYGTCSGDLSNPSNAPASFHVCHHSHEADEDLNVAIKNYFALDSLGIAAPAKELLSTDDERAISIQSSSTHLANGRYTTGLLWKYDDVRLPNNKSMALRRHKCLMKRMKRDPNLGTMLKKKMTDYVNKGYIRKLFP